jgi:DNA-binding transcriptional ArsR family regulator
VPRRRDNLALDATYGALSDARRRRILELLAAGPRKAGDIAAAFPEISRIAVRKHLAILEDARLVRAEPSGRERWYSFTPGPLGSAIEWAEHYHKFWESKLESLEEHVRDS